MQSPERSPVTTDRPPDAPPAAGKLIGWMRSAGSKAVATLLRLSDAPVARRVLTPELEAEILDRYAYARYLDESMTVDQIAAEIDHDHADAPLLLRNFLIAARRAGVTTLAEERRRRLSMEGLLHIQFPFVVEGLDDQDRFDLVNHLLSRPLRRAA